MKNAITSVRTFVIECAIATLNTFDGPCRSAGRYVLLLAIITGPVNQLSVASDRISILSFAGSMGPVDRSGKLDASDAFALAIGKANSFTVNGEPACIYVPAGIYKIMRRPPAFVGAGCITGDGPSQSIIKVDPTFEGDLFVWSEAWSATHPGPRVVGLGIVGDRKTKKIQNALVFYDRNEQVYLDSIDVIDLHGRALYSGVKSVTEEAFMRESHMRSLRFFSDGAPGIPVVEFNSEGQGSIDATNAIRMSQVDIYGARGPSFIIRNSGTGRVRGITIDGLRIEGSEDGSTQGDLLTIGDPKLTGNVNNITLSNIELVDPSKGYAALRITAPGIATAPYQITVYGSIDGGVPLGRGLVIDAGRQSYFHFSGIHTMSTNVTLGPLVNSIYLDGNGLETGWTYNIDASSVTAIHIPSRVVLSPDIMRQQK